MRKIILDLAISLDGFIEGPNGETDWCVMDEDMDFPGFLSGIDTIFYGRVSYQNWGEFQPDRDASSFEKELWKTIHEKNKVVFTRQGTQTELGAPHFISDNMAAQVQQIKSGAGKDIWLYGGANLIKSFERQDLIDVYQLSVHPVVLGSGKPLFEDLTGRKDLRLRDTRVYRSGVVQLIYESKGPA